MKKVLIAICFSVLGGVVSASPASVATGEYPPYTGQNLESGGLVNGLVQKIADKAEVDIEFEYLPWKRSLELVRSGAHDALSFWSELPDQSGLAMIGPVSVGSIVVFYRKDKPLPPFSKIDEVTGVTIGVTLGYTYDQSFWDHVNTGAIKTEQAKDDLSNFRKLIAGRIDAFVVDELVGRSILNENFSAAEIESLEHSQTSISELAGYLMISLNAPSGQELANKLQKAFEEMNETGEWEAQRDALLQQMGLSE